jgi:hypothetical protein
VSEIISLRGLSRKEPTVDLRQGSQQRCRSDSTPPRHWLSQTQNRARARLVLPLIDPVDGSVGSQDADWRLW